VHTSIATAVLLLAREVWEPFSQRELMPMGAASSRAERREAQGRQRLVKEAGRAELEGLFSARNTSRRVGGVYGLGYLPDFLMPPPCSGPLPLAFSCIALSACTTRAAGL
jgi:hypothetical protein